MLREETHQSMNTSEWAIFILQCGLLSSIAIVFMSELNIPYDMVIYLLILFTVTLF